MKWGYSFIVDASLQKIDPGPKILVNTDSVSGFIFDYDLGNSALVDAGNIAITDFT